jgi:hypothetical protein
MAATLPRLQPQVQAWTSSTLDAVVWADILGSNVAPVMRADAMAIPAIARGRHLTCGTIAGCPQTVMRLDTPVTPQPGWVTASDGQWGIRGADGRLVTRVNAGRPPEWQSDIDRLGLEPQSLWQRMLDTVDDHVFYGESLWVVTAYEGDASDTPERGRPARMLRVPWDFWDRQLIEQADGVPLWLFTDRGGEPIQRGPRPLGLVFIPGPHEGICNFGQRTIRASADLERSAADIAARPFRLELHQTTDLPLEPEEIAELVAGARKALADNQGILFTNAAIESKDHGLTGDGGGDLLIGVRNAAAVDAARIVSIPSALIDATTPGASLEYATLEGRNQQWIDYGLSLYMDAITARLGMDDVLPQGQRVTFDLSHLTSTLPAPTGVPTED